MGKTVIEKIFTMHSKDPVKPENVIWLDIDVRTARDFGGPNVVKNYKQYYNDKPLDDPKKTFFTFDLVAPAKTIKYAENQAMCRSFAQKHGIRVYDVDRGIGSHVLMEEGYILPGKTAVGTDSHYNIVGAIGAFGQGMGDVDITFAFKTGKVWFEVPYTVKINIKGKYHYPTTAKDLTLFILKNIKTDFALGRAIEFYGEIFKDLKLYERITLASMVTEMGGIIGFMPFTEEVVEEIKKFSGKNQIKPFSADKNAFYEKEIEINIENLKTQIAVPPHPHNVYNVKDLKNEKVDFIFVGSCTNGRTEDIQQVAKILKGKKIKREVVLSVVPATKRVYGELLKSKALEILYEAGAVISNPSCAGCAEGHIGLTGEGEIQLSTSNRNFPGKQGKGKTFLVSPVTAACAALYGKIVPPEEVL